jgi:hypothetical protein
MEVDWLEFKIFVDDTGCSIQYVKIKNNYWLKAIFGRFEIECYIPTNTNDANTMVFLGSYIASSNRLTTIKTSPFTSKVTSEGKKVYKREQGIQSEVAIGENIIVFTIPYPWVKLTGVEVINGENLDTVDVSILDSATGDYSTIPNHPLNQFGFKVNIADGIYACRSTFDADLYLGMQIRVVYTSQTVKKIGINFALNEVK